MSDLLTQAQVDALPDGTIVEIIWAGGNGPHRYEVHHRDGRSYALLTDDHPFAAEQKREWAEHRWARDAGLIEYVTSDGTNQRCTWVRLPGTRETWPHCPLTWRSDGRTSCPNCNGECKFADHEHNQRFIFKAKPIRRGFR